MEVRAMINVARGISEVGHNVDEDKVVAVRPYFVSWREPVIQVV